MAKKTKEVAPKRPWLSFAFTFVGSVIFLGVVSMSSLLLNGSTSLWQPLLYSAAIIGSLVVFVGNIVNLACPGSFPGRKLAKVGLVTGFSLIALTFALANPTVFSLSVLGFLLVFFGSSMASRCGCECGCCE